MTKQKITKKRKRIVQKRRRVTKKHSIFLYPYTNLKKWLKNGMKEIRKEQRHCLRFKKYKKRQTFCFVKTLLIKYPRRVIVSFLIFSFIGSTIIYSGLQHKNAGEYFGINLQTNLINDWISKIKSLTGQVDNMKKCTEDKYWKEQINEVCNYWLYQQENKHCAKFNVKTKRLAIGTKICCNPLESIVYDGPKKNVTACPGSDIFFDAHTMFDSIILEDSSKCELGVCEFYPAEGFIIKKDLYGNIVRGEGGQPIVMKPCPVTRKEGPCDKNCGGGRRVVTGQDMYCNQYSMQELCNLEPCFTETAF